MGFDLSVLQIFNRNWKGSSSVAFVNIPIFTWSCAFEESS